MRFITYGLVKFRLTSCFWLLKNLQLTSQRVEFCSTVSVENAMSGLIDTLSTAKRED